MKFTYAQLVSFGNYVLSQLPNKIIDPPQVSHADLSNWMEQEGLGPYQE